MSNPFPLDLNYNDLSDDDRKQLNWAYEFEYIGKKAEVDTIFSAFEEYVDMISANWSVDNRFPGTDFADLMNQWDVYDTHLFPNEDFTQKVALEFGCGDGRNIIRFNNRFQRIDGVDISQGALNNAHQNLTDAGIAIPKLRKMEDGRYIPAKSESYDVVFSTVVLQSIPNYIIRHFIHQELYRILKPGGYLCFQMGLDQCNNNTVNAWESKWYDPKIEGQWDCYGFESAILQHVKQFIGYNEVNHSITEGGPGDAHSKWIWIQCKK